MVKGGSYHISYIRRQFHDVLMIFLPFIWFFAHLFVTLQMQSAATVVSREIFSYEINSVLLLFYSR